MHPRGRLQGVGVGKGHHSGPVEFGPVEGEQSGRDGQTVVAHCAVQRRTRGQSDGLVRTGIRRWPLVWREGRAGQFEVEHDVAAAASRLMNFHRQNIWATRQQ